MAQNLLLWSLVVPLIDASTDGPVDIVFIRGAVHSQGLVGVDLPILRRLAALWPKVLARRTLNSIDCIHIQLQILHALCIQSISARPPLGVLPICVAVGDGKARLALRTTHVVAQLSLTLRVAKRLVLATKIEGASSRRRTAPEWTLADLAEVRNGHRLIWHRNVIKHVMHFLLVLFLHSLKHLIPWTPIFRGGLVTTSAKSTKIH